MNNGFPGAFTSTSNNMGLSCQPNFNSSQPGHCLLHHVNSIPAPISHFSHHCNSVQNSAMDLVRISQMNSMRGCNSAITWQSARPHHQISSSNSCNRRLLAVMAVKDQVEERLAQRKTEVAKSPASKSAAKMPVAKTVTKTLTPESLIQPFAAKPADKSLMPKYVAKNPAAESARTNHYFLSNAQLTQKDKELAECQSLICNISTETKWLSTDLSQGVSFGAGMIVGVPAGIYDTVDGIIKAASNPTETYQALKSLYDSDNMLGHMGVNLRQSWSDSADRMEAEYQKGGLSGSFNAGVEGGKLVSDVAGLLAGATGVVASGGGLALIGEKLFVKVAAKAE